MKEVNKNSFDEYLTFVEESEKKSSAEKGHHSSLLFRGQKDSELFLRTTLERYSSKSFSLCDYLRIVESCKSEIECFAGKSWNRFSGSANFTENIASLHTVPNAIELMIYLRHHGFPSPLLDWTESPYIAAYFAYIGAKKEGSVSIYIYKEYAGKGKAGWAAEPKIKSLAPDVVGDKRHHSQQAQYTICSKDEDGKSWFCNHEEVFSRNENEQDILKKVNLPASERDHVLKKLNRMNINSYTLFHDEDGLARHLAFKHITRGDL